MAIGARFLRLLVGSIVLASALARGDVIDVEVSKWSETGTGVTEDGWQVCKLVSYSDRGVRFGSKEAFAISPVLPGFVTQAVVTVRSSSLSVHCYMTVTPEGSTGEAIAAEPTERYQDQTFVWEPSDCVRQLRFQNAGDGNAGWGIAGLRLFLDRIEPPTDLSEPKLYRDAFEANWSGSARAVRHELEVSAVAEEPSRYDLLREWDFSTLTNGVNRTRGLEELSVPVGLDGFSGENLCLQGLEGGHLQVGKNKVAGFVSFLVPAAPNRTCLVEMFGHTSDNPGVVTMRAMDAEGLVVDGTSPFLTESPTLFRFDLPDDATGLVLQSLASRRIRVRRVLAVTEYVEGFVRTNVTFVTRTPRTVSVAWRLHPGEWLWRVRSFDALGLDSPWSAYRELRLLPDLPRYSPPGCVMFLR